MFARRRLWMACLIAVAATHSTANEPPAAPPDDFAARLPRIPPLAPEAALASFRVVTGYRVEGVAAEPLVADPVAADFDADGRLFVVEMCGYSEQREENRGRVRLLEDVDDDGRMDRATVFLDGLRWPTAVLCAQGGVFVADAPDLFFARDTDGDGDADERRTVFTGFLHHNVQGLVNSLRFGLDGWIHGSTSTCGANLRRPDRPDEPASELRGRDFAFDPRSLTAIGTSGGGQHGMDFDAVGRKFLCANSDHVQLVMCEDRYLARNRWLLAPAARESIAADGPQAEVFRASPVEPWRTLRTELRVSGRAPGPIEGGGRAAGYFTSATGLTIYGGDAWPAEARGLAIVGDVGGNLVHRKRLAPRGVGLIAERIDAGRELLASEDIWFRPAQFVHAPDGTLYILDVYREVIEHPDSLPPEIKRHLDLTSGRDRGRIYRLAPEGFVRRATPKLSRATTAELAALLSHPNRWHRQTASRLLDESDDPAVVESLRVAARGPEALGRLHALYRLARRDALTDETLQAAMADVDPHVRRHAVRLAEPRLPDSEPLRSDVCRLAGDPDIEVRFQVAFSLGEFGDDANRDRLASLAALVKGDGQERWFEVAIQSSLGEQADALLSLLVADADWLASAKAPRWIGLLVAQHAIRDQELPPSLAARLADPRGDDAVVRGYWLSTAFAELARLGLSPAETLARLRLAEPPLSAHWEGWQREAETVAADSHSTPERRRQAIELLAIRPEPRHFETLVECLAPAAPPEVQSAALAAIAAAPSGARRLLAEWGGLSPPLRRAAADALLARDPEALLASIEAGEIEASHLAVDHWQRLATHPEASIRRRAERLSAAPRDEARAQVVARYQSALSTAGDPAQGRALFQKHCSACHRLEDVGREIGAQLTAFAAKGPEALLTAILDPNREVNPQYLSYTVVLEDGRVLAGLIAGESAASVTLANGDGRIDVLRSQIDTLTATGRSLMPEGFEQQLDARAMADLLAYLSEVR